MVEKDAVRRGYDELAEEYAEQRPAEGRQMDLLGEFLEPVGESARLLDVGCGQGTPVLSRLAELGPAVGVDFSRSQLNLADEDVPEADLLQGDMTRLPVRDGAFDALTAYHSLIHVPHDEHQAVVDEFARVLRPGGRVLVSEGPNEWCGENPDWLDTGTEMQWHIAGADATRDHLRNAGFTVEDEWGTTDEFADEEERWVYFSAQLASSPDRR
ncbi:class I SAM-dependent methyltransferase [Halorussus lipolyticus]|uniref:class I SAM-dependent methyltransferase n=1 Tax=Halorussus lipolyticus TaxID=3034024 RepID=UPI0023E7B98D|nr:class I SAM-dependent methyltransferase [Halorussus sp. DT80]